MIELINGIRKRVCYWIINFCFTFYRIQKRNESQLEIHAQSERFDEIINFLVKNEIFLHLNIRYYRDYSITDKFLQEQIDRYTPSEEHRKKCKYDLCHRNAKLEFIDTKWSVTICKSSKEEEEHKKCQDDLCHKNAKLDVIDSKGFVANSKTFKDHRNVTKFRKKKCTIL